MCGICLLLRCGRNGNGRNNTREGPSVATEEVIPATENSKLSEDVSCCSSYWAVPACSLREKDHVMWSSRREDIGIGSTLTPVFHADSNVFPEHPANDAEEKPSKDSLKPEFDSKTSLHCVVLKGVQRRGPDILQEHQHSFLPCQTNPIAEKQPTSLTEVKEEHGYVPIEMRAVAAVLGLRGSSVVPQPYFPQDDGSANQHQNKSFLLWNGEVFGGALCPPTLNSSPGGASDTVAIAQRLYGLEREAAATMTSSRSHPTALERKNSHLLCVVQHTFLRVVTSVLEEEVEGPYSFVYFAASLQLVIFGRDPLGRRSLLVHVTALQSGVELLVSSVGAQHQHAIPYERLNATARSCLINKAERSASSTHARSPSDEVVTSLERKGGSQAKRRREEEQREEPDSGAGAGGAEVPLTVSCWAEVPVHGLHGFSVAEPLSFVLRSTVAESLVHAAADVKTETKEEGGFTVRFMQCPWPHTHHLVHPLQRGLLRITPCSLLSRWSPSAWLEALVTRLETQGVPDWCPLPLQQVLKRMSQQCRRALCAFHESATEKEVCGPAAPPRLAVQDFLRHHAAWHYLWALAGSVHRRIRVSTAGADAGRRPMGILFSGGLDCTVLAALAHLLLPAEIPLELINVAFGKEPCLAPDRIAALRAVKELLQLPPADDFELDSPGVCRNREWRLVLVDVPEKTSPAFSPAILDLLTPHASVMDVDIGTALWHAARGRGRMQRLPHHVDVNRTACGEVASTTGSSATEGNKSEALAPHHKISHVGASLSSSLCAMARDEIEETRAVPSEKKKDPLPPAETCHPFELLRHVLLKECRETGAGPDIPVLLSTLGKAYSGVLTPHFRAHGFRKLGAYLDAASRQGIVRFDSQAGKSSKAVFLALDEDIREATRAAALARRETHSDWYRTPAMQHEEEMQDSGRGTHVCGTPLPPEGTYLLSYCCEARVLLLGIGADETLGGYTRHRRLFQREGVDGALRELQRDFARLWQRNLGRDDRLTMDSGREARLPYLDEELLRSMEDIVAVHASTASLLSHFFGSTPPSSAEVKPPTTAGGQEQPEGPLEGENAWWKELPVAALVDFRLGPGEGDKRVLRHIARALGLNGVSRLEKRAIQFGSRMAERKVHGSTSLL